jgi:hypothetical protein
VDAAGAANLVGKSAKGIVKYFELVVSFLDFNGGLAAQYTVGFKTIRRIQTKHPSLSGFTHDKVFIERNSVTRLTKQCPK